jgi:DNA-binding MarR family transcriptional regulator
VADTKTSSTSVETDPDITLALLNAVESNSRVTQRSVAKELGIALGLANSYLKRCIRKGLIKVSQAPANRYAYYLTPQGFAEKSRLTASYLSISFNFFREARKQCAEMFAICEEYRWRRIAFCGQSDFVEIATLCAPEFDVELVGIVDPASTERTFSGIPVFHGLDDIGTIDAAIISDLVSPQATFDRVTQVLPASRVLAPRFSNISRQKPQLAE